MPPFPIVQEVQSRLEESGLHGALALLNSRTPHRFTGAYRYDGEVLRNEGLYDRFSPEGVRGEDVPMPLAYCALVGERNAGLEFADAREDPRFAWKPGSPVVSYCGALMRDESGRPYGTLCHFDALRCEPNMTELEQLEKVAPLIFRWLRARSASARH
ncbi:MAG: hypothetical protein ABIT71_12025 [Vicinamibacteraceae bacterium]